MTLMHKYTHIHATIHTQIHTPKYGSHGSQTYPPNITSPIRVISIVRFDY